MVILLVDKSPPFCLTLASPEQNTHCIGDGIYSYPTLISQVIGPQPLCAAVVAGKRPTITKTPRILKDYEIYNELSCLCIALKEKGGHTDLLNTSKEYFQAYRDLPNKWPVCCLNEVELRLEHHQYLS